jgi:hypothetical protein
MADRQLIGNNRRSAQAGYRFSWHRFCLWDNLCHEYGYHGWTVRRSVKQSRSYLIFAFIFLYPQFDVLVLVSNAL